MSCVPSFNSTWCFLLNSYSRRLLENGFHQQLVMLMKRQLMKKKKKKKKGILMMLQQRRVAQRLFHLGGHGFATPRTQPPSSSLLLSPAFTNLVVKLQIKKARRMWTTRNIYAMIYMVHKHCINYTHEQRDQIITKDRYEKSIKWYYRVYV